MPGAGAPAASSLPGPLPAFFEFIAPQPWRAIDFISDLHLCEALPRTFAAWAGHLRNTSADAVFILGDLFEVWVGDDQRSLAFERQCMEVLAEASRHRHLAFMAGNRDFLLGQAMLRDSGMTHLPDPCALTAWGRRVLISHGDALCLGDAPYQAFRQEVRSMAWQVGFLARPLAQRIVMAAEMRRASQTRSRFDGDASADIDAPEAARWLRAAGAAEMVHGHTHRPGSAELARGVTRHVLSDWDLDRGTRAEVLRLTREGFARLPPARE